ncbi:MAG: rhomboid family intramembrane serine protease [Bacteroidota bacterium]
MLNRITPVVKYIIIINVVVFALTMLLNNKSIAGYFFERDILAFWPPKTGLMNPFQIVTHMFMHSGQGIGHIFFNMLTLFFLGPMVEHKLGSKKFLNLFLISGFGALAAHFLVGYVRPELMASVLGASGAIFGVMVAFGMLFPDTKLMLIFPPIPIKAKYLVTGLVILDIVSGLRGSTIFGATNVAHFAHLGGALTGFLLILVWNNFKLK